MFANLLAVAVAIQSTDDGLTLRELIADLPTDPASVFTLALLFAGVAAVLWTGRGRPGGGSMPPRAPG